VTTPTLGKRTKGDQFQLRAKPDLTKSSAKEIIVPVNRINESRSKIFANNDISSFPNRLIRIAKNRDKLIVTMP
jgi:hypothetical protein